MSEFSEAFKAALAFAAEQERGDVGLWAEDGFTAADIRAIVTKDCIVGLNEAGEVVSVKAAR